MEELLCLVKQRGVAAPAPIEQRWTAGSGAPMSPAHGPPASLHSWVGVIMYLPEDAEQRQAVTARWAAAAAGACACAGNAAACAPASVVVLCVLLGH